MNPQQIPLSLYIHIPWCIKKCPYCDFNSHSQSAPIDEKSYIDHLLKDLAYDYQRQARPIQSIFIGGGTPSLLSGEAIKRLIKGIQQHTDLKEEAEITLEANPGTFEQKKFSDYLEAGINRLSLGIQSFHTAHLKKLGRIHDSTEAHQAINHAQKIGYKRINLDLMFALSGQTIKEAQDDLEQALSYHCEHLSWYQLTLEPHTAYAHNPPPLPDDDQRADIFEAGKKILEQHGYKQYETSAWSNNKPSTHNLNYWQYGDYIGIGAGAHGKITLDENHIIRTRKYRAPSRYQKAESTYKNPYQDQEENIPKEEQAFEFMMNALRLKQGVAKNLLTERTLIKPEDIAEKIEKLINKKLLKNHPTHYKTTAQGYLFLNNLLNEFL